MRVRRASTGIEICRETKEQHVAQKIENRFVHRRVSAFGSADGAFDDFTIFFAYGLTRSEIGSVNRETGDRLAHSTRERLEREITVPTAPLRKPIEHVAEHIDVVRQRELHHLELFRIQQMTKRHRVTDETMKRFCDRFLGRGIDEQLRYLIGKIVASGAVQAPIVAQPLGTCEDFLGDHVNGAPIFG